MPSDDLLYLQQIFVSVNVIFLLALFDFIKLHVFGALTTPA